MDLITYQSEADAVIAVLVLYKTRLEDSETFVSLSNSLKSSKLIMDVVVYDNSPAPMVSNPEYVSDDWRIHYIHDETNPGVSKAYNEGIRIAQKLNKEWILLLDQDTTFPIDAITKYLQAIREYKGQFLFAPVLKSGNKIWSPCRYFLKRGFHLNAVEIGINSIRGVTPLNSGVLLHTSVFEKTGIFNEKLKLDFSDFYFIEKYKKHFTDIVILDFVCAHEISTTKENGKNVEESLNRFRYFCEGAKHSANNSGEFLILALVVVFRSLKLSVKFKNINFLAVVGEKFLRR